MGLRLAAPMRGVDTAQRIRLVLEYDPQPPFDTGSVDGAPPEMVESVRQLVGGCGRPTGAATSALLPPAHSAGPSLWQTAPVREDRGTQTPVTGRPTRAHPPPQLRHDPPTSMRASGAGTTGRWGVVRCTAAGQCVVPPGRMSPES
ncbi:hypothetical protein GCM10009799_24810 [Nocardiopsis rhodophaea]|uniref:Uncharacterized protein n=1 Tax=Nocardiopsis rhodophaea TaxID=280238 RepID=A0ABN2T1S8_9ACTN